MRDRLPFKLCLAAYHLVSVNVELCLSAAPFEMARSMQCSVTLLQFCEFGPLTGMPFSLRKLSRRSFEPRSRSISCCFRGLVGLCCGFALSGVDEPGICRPCEL